MMENAVPEESLSGTVENVVFHNKENGFTVIELNVSGECITAVGVLADVAPGEEIGLTGRWDSHTVFGRQFKITSCRRTLPDTVGKLYRYLASGAVKGVGPKTAMKIVERFGEESFDVLENHPEKLSCVNGISKTKAVDICAEFAKQYSMRKMMLELEDRGITPEECTAIYKEFGVNSLNLIKENPYILCLAVSGFSFERVEELAEKMELTPKAIYRNRAGVLHILSHNLNINGHTCIPKRAVLPLAGEFLSVSSEEIEQTLSDLSATGQIVIHEVNEEPFLFLPAVFAAEKSISEHLTKILRFPPSFIRSVEDDIKKTEERNGFLYAEKQRLAIQTAAEKGFLILTGGPGTGKTTTVKGIIDVFERRHMNVLLCAPTGMAAKRMTELTGREAKTVHRLLEVEWDESETPSFRRNAENPLSAGCIIVDEMSMVDVQLFASLLDAVPFGCRIVLVGDSDQLPSVGPGNVLGDLISSGVLPVVCLTEIFRQAQKSLIVVNAHKIIAGEQPLLNRTDSDFFFLKRNDSLLAAQTVEQLLISRLPNAYGFSPFDDIQILCPSRKGDCGTVNLNTRLQNVLNPKNSGKNELVTYGGRVFREGDRVMQIKNNYHIAYEKGSEQGEGIFNGDIGVIRKINFASGYMTICFDDRIAEYPNDNLSELELAYAVTVHKSQGSEYPAVIIPVIDCPLPLMYRNLLYTGVTRAKKILILVGNEGKILQMVENNKRNRRYSALKQFLRE